MDKKFYLIAAVFLGIGFLGGFLVCYSRSGNYPLPKASAPNPTQAQEVSSLMFKKQTAMVEGKVVEVGEDFLVVADPQNQKQQFPVSDNFIVYVPIKNTKQASASSQLKQVEKNKDSLIILELIEDTYKVVSLSYIPQ